MSIITRRGLLIGAASVAIVPALPAAAVKKVSPMVNPAKAVLTATAGKGRHISSIVVFNRDLTESERATVETWMAETTGCPTIWNDLA